MYLHWCLHRDCWGRVPYCTSLAEEGTRVVIWCIGIGIIDIKMIPYIGTNFRLSIEVGMPSRIVKVTLVAAGEPIHYLASNHCKFTCCDISCQIRLLCLQFLCRFHLGHPAVQSQVRSALNFGLYHCKARQGRRGCPLVQYKEYTSKHHRDTRIMIYKT